MIDKKRIEGFERELKEGRTSIESVLKEVEKDVESAEKELKEIGDKVLLDVREELEKKIKVGRLGEALASIKSTFVYLSSLEIKAPKGGDREEVMKRHKEYEASKDQKGFGWRKKLKENQHLLIEELQKYINAEMVKRRYDAKIALREEIRKYLEDKREEIRIFKEDLKKDREQVIEKANDENIQYQEVKDLVVSEFKLGPSLKYEKIKEKWATEIEEDGNKITKKVWDSLTPNLESLFFLTEEIDVGYKTPEGKEATSKQPKIMVVLPDYVKEDVKVAAKKFISIESKGNQVTVYKFAFGIKLDEIKVIE